MMVSVSESSPPIVRFRQDLPTTGLTGHPPQGLVIGDEQLRLDDDIGGRAVARHDIVGPATVGDLTAGLQAWQAVNIHGAYWHIDGVGTNLLLFLHDETRELRVAIWFDVELDEDAALEASLPGLLAPVLARWGAGMALDSDPYQGQWLTVQVTMPDRARRVADLLACAAEVEALVGALQDGALTFAAARDLVLGGHAGALAGAREGAWLDVKGAPYLSNPSGMYELAKDVAAFANADGGLILIPATSRHDGTGEVVDEVRDLPRDHVRPQAWIDNIAGKVYPEPAGVEVVFVGLERGQLLVVVPAQADERKPFLVRGAIEGERVLTHAITLPWRDGDRTRFDDIGRVHAALRQQRAGSTTDDELIERVQLATMPVSLRGLVGHARAAGLQTDVSHAGLRIHVPGEVPIDVFVSDWHPKLEQMAMHVILERLARHGVESRRTPAGFLVLPT